MRVLNRILVAALVTLTLLAPGLTKPADAASTATTFVTAFSDTYDYTGEGTNWLWQGNQHVSVREQTDGDQQPDGIYTIEATGGQAGKTLNLSFAAGHRGPLTTGRYTGAVWIDEQTGDQPGMDINGDLQEGDDGARGCGEGLTGSFDVRDIAPDLSHMWITYEQHCAGRPVALFGEIRFQEPGGDGDLLVAPTQIDWPDAYRDLPAHEVPVTLVDTGEAPVRVSDASITDGASEFSVVDSSCGTLLPGDSCAVDVSYTPRQGERHQGELTIQDNTTAGEHVVPLSGGIIPGYTSWTMRGQEQDYIDGGQTLSLAPGGSPFWASGNQSEVGFYSADQWWDASFAAPLGQVLHPGTTYTGVMRTPFAEDGAPGLEIYGDGRACNTLTGSFHLRELTFDQQGHMSSFAATFTQHCDGQVPALVGSIAWQAARPADPVPTAAKFAPHLTLAKQPPVFDGDTILVHGKVWSLEPYEGLPSKRVYLYSRPRGSRPWTLMTSVVTDSAGNYSVPYRIHRNTEYQARYRGDRDHVPVTSAVRTVIAKWRVTLKHAGNLPGGHVRLRCAVLHGRAHQVVFLQIQNSRGQWGLVGTHRLNSHGATYIVVKRPTRTSGIAYRVVAKASYGRSPGPSGYVHVVKG